MKKKALRILLIVVLCLLSFFPIKCTCNQISFKLKMRMANYIVENYKTEPMRYEGIVKTLGKPWMRKENRAEFFIKSDAFIVGISFTSLHVVFDQEGVAKEAFIYQAD